jgi:16S rRNA (guanine966-N2)-methyltransferase
VPVRIIGGRHAGMALTSPSGRVRPTAEPVRAAAIALLDGALENARVLDLFAGAGTFGLEALSRGAASCDFVENGPSAIHALKANVAMLRARDRTRIFTKDAILFADRLPAGAYDLAYADPPYDSRKLDRILETWQRTPFARTLVLEHAADHDVPKPARSRRVEDTVLSVYESS